jgi:hypothetical protein
LALEDEPSFVAQARPRVVAHVLDVDAVEGELAFVERPSKPAMLRNVVLLRARGPVTVTPPSRTDLEAAQGVRPIIWVR